MKGREEHGSEESLVGTISVQGTWLDSCPAGCSCGSHHRAEPGRRPPRSPPAAAGPHRHSAAGTPRCSPAALAHTAAPASSLSETWVPALRRPGGWACWAHRQPSGSLKAGSRRQLVSGVSGQESCLCPLTPLSCLLSADCWPGSSLTLQHPVQATQHLPHISEWVWACRPPTPPPLAWCLSSPSPAPLERTEAVLGVSTDGDGMEGKVLVWAVAAMSRWVTDGAGQLRRHRTATPVLPGPRKGAAGCPARIIVSRESPEGGNPFI